MLKVLDSSLKGLRVGRTRFMDGTKVAPIIKVGPLGIGRKVIGEFEPLSSITLESGHSTFENDSAGRDVRFDPERGLEIYRWSDDVLGLCY